ncbi:MAG: isochorismatase family protein [Proteobacteria bacterium]|nr:isochorismatase family protein [Pseudomonadota bacterium]
MTRSAFLQALLGLAGTTATAMMAASPASASAPSASTPTPTIRAMSGAKPLAGLDPKTTALVVIDFQDEYFGGRMPIPDGARAMAEARRLIAWADQAAIPVYQVQHVAPEGAALFALGGERVRFHPDIAPRPRDVVLQKTTVSVFASTDLHARLQASGIRTIVIAGLMTHACVAGAARDAAPLGYQVVVAEDACATRSIRRADGQAVEAGALHRAALAEIEDTFGDVLPTASILALPLR